GPGGASTAMFTAQATQPILPMPGKGDQKVQPDHIDDLDEIVDKLATGQRSAGDVSGRTDAAVGPTPMTMREYYAALRRALGVQSPGLFAGTPMSFMRMLAWAGQRIPGSHLDPDPLSMLERGNVAPSG